MAFDILNGTTRSPHSYSVDVYDIDREEGTGRDENGDMFRDRVATKVKIFLSWTALTPSELADILQATSEVFFTVEYLDPRTNTYEEGTFYVGDRKMPLYKRKGNTWVWEKLELNLIQQ